MSDSILSTNSRERSRQIENIRRVARGEKVEKKIYVQMEDLDEKKKRREQVLAERQEKSDRSDALKGARTPWFCPKCDKAMKKKLDRKFWSTQGHCMDCQIEFENKLRVKGEFDNYAKKKINENKKAYLKDLKQSLVEFEETGGKVEWFNDVGALTPELEKEKWEMGEDQFNTIVEEARDFIREKKELVEKAENELQGAK